ncbi:MAG: hypothetical protein WC475_04085 [Candidatus Paceibacterota bacterium]
MEWKDIYKPAVIAAGIFGSVYVGCQLISRFILGCAESVNPITLEKTTSSLTGNEVTVSKYNQYFPMDEREYIFDIKEGRLIKAQNSPVLFAKYSDKSGKVGGLSVGGPDLFELNYVEVNDEFRKNIIPGSKIEKALMDARELWKEGVVVGKKHNLIK